MSVLNLLTVLKETESKFGRLYHWLSELYADDQEAAIFLYHLGLEEFAHASLAGYAAQLVRNRTEAQKREVAERVDLGVADILKASARMDEVRQSPPPPIDEAFRIVIDLECYVFEYHLREQLVQAVPECATLLNRLKAADQQHHRELVEFAVLRKYIAPVSS